ncbi:MAG: FHA domain-containing protein [Actinomycetota bacterium]
MAELSLEIIEGPDAGRRMEVSGTLEIGRDPRATVVLRDPLISRRHVRLTPGRGVVTIEDLGSLNGTFLNGNQLHGPAEAGAGDQVLVGVSVLQLRSTRQVAERPSAARAVPLGLTASSREPLPRSAASDPRAQAVAPGLEALLDRNTKRLALIAPLAIGSLAVMVLLIFLATR